MKRIALPVPARLSRAPQQGGGALAERKSSFMPGSSLATPGKARPEKDHRNLKDRSWQRLAVSRAVVNIDGLGMQSLCPSSMQPRAIWTLKEIYTVLEGFVAGLFDVNPGVATSSSQASADSKQRVELLYSRIEFLGYRYSLGRQVLNSPNTPHNWPLVLGLIDFLCDRLEQRIPVREWAEQFLSQPGDCRLPLGDILQAQEEAYAFFLQHGKDGGQLERLTEPDAIRRRRDAARWEEKARATEEEARAMEERAAPARRMQQELLDQQERVARAEQELERLRQHRAQLEAELPQKDADLAAGRVQLERLRGECELLSERIRAQPISQAQLMSLRGDIKELESYIGRLDETLANTEREIGVAETQLSADHDRLSQVCNQTNVRLAYFGLPQRAVPELSETAQQANQTIEPALRRLLADLAEQIERSGHRREEARRRHAALTDAMDTQQARLATIRSMIVAEKSSRRKAEEATQQEVNAAIEAALGQLADCEAARDRQRDRLARALARDSQSAGRLALAEGAFARSLAGAVEAVQRTVAEISRMRERRNAVHAVRRQTSVHLADIQRRCNRYLVTVVGDIVGTGSPNLMAMLLPPIQAQVTEHRRRLDEIESSAGAGGAGTAAAVDPALAAMFDDATANGGDSSKCTEGD